MAGQKKAAKNEVVELEGDLSVQDAVSVRETLLKAIQKSESVTVDFSKLEDLEVSILQLLCALEKEAVLRNKTLSFSGTFGVHVKRAFLAAGFIDSINVPDNQIYSQFAEKAGK